MKKTLLLFASLWSLLYVHSQAGTLDPAFAGKGWTYTDFKKGNNYVDFGLQVLVQKDGTYVILIRTNGYAMLTRYFSDGTLDTSFNKSGYSAAIQLYGAKAALQSNGGIVVAGSPASAPVFFLTRYNADGSLDSTFGENGKVITDFPGGDDAVTSIAVQSDDKIIVGGNTYVPPDDGQSEFHYEFALARYNTDGSLDSTFDGDGKLSTDFGGGLALALALQSDGKIVVGGSVLVRFNSNGSLDSTFGENGTASDIYFARSIALQKDGKIIVVPESTVLSDFELKRYNRDGSLDSTFGTNGKVTTDVGGFDISITVAVQGNDKIVVAGCTSVPNTGVYDFALTRYNDDGSLDSSFDGDGKVTTDFGGNDFANSVAIQSNDRIIVAGGTSVPKTGNEDFAFARYKEDGSLDSTFDEDGKLTGYYPAGAFAIHSIAVQRDNKIVAGGSIYDLTTGIYNFALARYNADGSLDSSLDGVGKLITNFKSHDYSNSIALQNDGKIIVAGNSYKRNTDTLYFTLARYKVDGSLDSSFDQDGIQVTDFDRSAGIAHYLAVQSDGKILVLGSIFHPDTFTSDFILARYNTDGSLDNTFNQNGKVTTDLGGFSDEAISLAIQNDGKIIVLGRIGVPSGEDFKLALIRYNKDGSLDSSFDKDGMLITRFFGSNYASSIAIQNNGKILLAGTDQDPNTYFSDFGLVRYNQDGSLDSSFGQRGMLTTDFGESDQVNSISLQGDGKIVAAGGTGIDVAIARYNGNGSLDSTFDADGKRTTDFGVVDIAYASAIYRNRLYVGGSSSNLDQRGVVAAYLLGCTEQVFYQDADQDGYGNVSEKVLACSAPEGYVSDSTDCNDSNAAIHPGAEEICGNGVDDNCNGQVDEGCTLVLTVNDTTVYESEGIATLTVTLSRKAEHPIYVPYFTVDGTARGFSWSKDYRAAWNILVIPAGAKTATIPIVIYEDKVREPDEYFDVYIFNYAYLAQGYEKGRVTIKDGAPNQTTPPITQVPALEQQQAHVQAADKLSANVYPNPTTHSFTLALQSAGNSPVVLTVRDASGRVIERKAGVSANTTLQLGASYRPGVYYAELAQGRESVTTKLVKQAY